MSMAGETPELQGLATRVKELERALNSARNARRLLTLATLVMVGISAVAFYRLGDSFRQPQNLEALVKEAQARLDDRADEYMKEVHTLVKNSSPKLTAAFYAQARQDLPLYLEAVGKQRELLIADLQGDLEQRITEVQNKAGDRYQGVIEQEFPQVTNSAARDRMRENMQQALSSLAKKYYVDQMREQVQSLFAKLESFPPAPAPRSDDASLDDQLLASMLDLLTLKLAAGDTDRNLPLQTRRRAAPEDPATPQASQAPLASAPPTAAEQPAAELANKPAPASEATPAPATEVAPATEATPAVTPTPTEPKAVPTTDPGTPPVEPATSP